MTLGGQEGKTQSWGHRQDWTQSWDTHKGLDTELGHSWGHTGLDTGPGQTELWRHKPLHPQGSGHEQILFTPTDP